MIDVVIIPIVIICYVLYACICISSSSSSSVCCHANDPGSHLQLSNEVTESRKVPVNGRDQSHEREISPDKRWEFGEIVNYRDNLVLRLTKYVVADSSFHCSARCAERRKRACEGAARRERKIKEGWIRVDRLLRIPFSRRRADVIGRIVRG